MVKHVRLPLRRRCRGVVITPGWPIDAAGRLRSRARAAPQTV
jgi:hypothetical protein